MYLLIVALLIVICVFLVLVVLVQNPKGGGMGAGFGGGASSAAAGGGGVQRTTDFLEKATWGLAVAFFTLSLLSNVFLSGGATDGPSTDDIDNVLEE